MLFPATIVCFSLFCWSLAVRLLFLCLSVMDRKAPSGDVSFSDLEVFLLIEPEVSVLLTLVQWIYAFLSYLW